MEWNWLRIMSNGCVEFRTLLPQKQLQQTFVSPHSLAQYILIAVIYSNLREVLFSWNSQFIAVPRSSTIVLYPFKPVRILTNYFPRICSYILLLLLRGLTRRPPYNSNKNFIYIIFLVPVTNALDLLPNHAISMILSL
jgi:hypothetical protein